MPEQCRGLPKLCQQKGAGDGRAARAVGQVRASKRDRAGEKQSGGEARETAVCSSCGGANGSTRSSQRSASERKGITVMLSGCAAQNR